MLIEIDSKTYNAFFPFNPHPFVSDAFIELNKDKVDNVVRLVDNIKRPGIGLVAGIKDGKLLSPFSAPFGGFHFRKEIVYISEIYSFLGLLKDYIRDQDLNEIKISLPPDIYHLTFNAKLVSSFMKCGFQFETPELTNWVDLNRFKDKFTQKNSKEYYRQAVRNGLVFDLASDRDEQTEVFNIICENRIRFGRPIYMTFEDIMNTGKLWPVDFFKICTKEREIVASGIFYRSHPEICYALFWGDSELGRPLKAMDFLTLNLWTFYKNLGYRYIDLGISTEAGIPNEGLLRFKESHEATTSVRYKFHWNKDMYH